MFNRKSSYALEQDVAQIKTAPALTTELLIDQVLLYPDKHMEIAYKIRDIFD